MGRQDALLCLDRHATSKIREADDLRGVLTFGFRGEALPAVASVSRLTLETRPPEDPVGTRIVSRGGQVVEVTDHPRKPGTTVLVESLFFNAPARARFLRPPGNEARAVSEALIPLALAYPEVALYLTSDLRPLLELPAVRTLQERVAAIWGEDAADTLLPLAAPEGEIQVEGLIQRPDAARPGFRRAHFFVEGRPFRDAALLRAADRGYRTTLPAEHRPWILLFLRVPRGAVDVNVHPTKAEVRFRDRTAVERSVEEAVRAALAGEPSMASFQESPSKDVWVGRERYDAGSPTPLATPATPPPPPVREEDSQMALFVPGGREATGAGAADSSPSISEQKALEPIGRPRLWQVHQAWILAEVRDGLLLIDQHAAHERVLFERIMAGFEEGEADGQRLLFPLILALTPAEVGMVEDLQGLLHRMGFEVERFGGDAVILHAIPNPHPYFDAERCFREIIDEVTHGSELMRSARNQHERLAMSFACKAAIKAGQPLNEREVEELFDQLFATRLPFHDVHGRPTTVRLSRGEMERKFGR